MDKQLDNKISSAYKNRDENFSYPRKEELWGKLATSLGHKKGVAAIWRAAAVVLALLSFGGVFAAITQLHNQSEKISEVEKQHLMLQYKIDSLLQIEPEKVVEIRMVEMEKVIYRDVANSPLASDLKEEEVEILKAENARLLEIENKMQSDLDLLRDSLMLAQSQILEGIQQNTVASESSSVKFKLKSERAKDEMSPVRTDIAPKMKLQILKVQDNIKYDTNSTLLKR